MLKTMGAFSTVALALSVTGCSATAQPETDLVQGWSIEDIQETGIRGVSPELIEIDGVSTLFVTSLDPQRVWHGDNARSFAPAPLEVPPGADFTVIDEGSQWRIYWADFIEMPQAGQPMSPDAKKQVVSATTTDLRSYSPATPTGVQQTGEGRAWGVPDTVVGPDGTVHMYWVDEVEGERREVLRHATSSNGIDFSVSPEPVMFGGYVDPFVLRAEEGDWLMLLSTTPHPSELPQKLHLARSSDGVAWEVDPTPLLTDPERNYLDPTAYPTGEDEWQIVFATSPKDSPLDPDLMMLVSGVLRASPQ